ncbi:hypothetical protein EDB83DRAFT_2312477 [Lactarius deliciosus]|nr:hypothetical protein EDB83DRAFT_2312477 [Lactarius deliciosus]
MAICEISDPDWLRIGHPVVPSEVVPRVRVTIGVRRGTCFGVQSSTSPPPSSSGHSRGDWANRACCRHYYRARGHVGEVPSPSRRGCVVVVVARAARSARVGPPAVVAVSGWLQREGVVSLKELVVFRFVGVVSTMFFERLPALFNGRHARAASSAPGPALGATAYDFGSAAVLATDEAAPANADVRVCGWNIYDKARWRLGGVEGE